LLLLFLIPLLVGAVLEYVLCRFPKRRLWRAVGPALAAAGTIAVGLFRYHGWSDGAEKAPLTTLLFVPGVPALGLVLGLFLGWRIYKRLWDPRLMDKEK